MLNTMGINSEKENFSLKSTESMESRLKVEPEITEESLPRFDVPLLPGMQTAQ